MKRLLLALIFAATCPATTRTAATCGTSDVQTVVTASSTGDTVNIPAGTCTWTSGISVSAGITIAGAGSGRIVAYSSSTLTIGTGSKTLSVATTVVGGTLSLSPGQSLLISETGTRTNFMSGTVTSYSSGTLVMNITGSGGTCGSNATSNCKRWLVSTPPTTIITNNDTSTYLFSVSENTSSHTNISGIKFAAGTGTVGNIDMQVVSGGKAILIHDCWMETGSATGTNIHTTTNRGVIWNCSFDASPFSMAPVVFQSQTDTLTTSWSTPSTMGTADTTGENNTYIETSDFHAFLNATDYDNNSRGVFRYNFMNNAGFGTHGVDTSAFGQRHFEYYNNVGNFNGYSDLTTFNMNWWAFVRGGTFVFANNTLPALVSTDYGTKNDVLMTEMALQRNAGPTYTACWGAGTSSGADYHAPHQVGMGYVTGAGTDGKGHSTYSLSPVLGISQYVGDSEPAYIWGNSRQPLTNVAVEDYGLGNGDSCPMSPAPEVGSDYIQLNRDYFNSATAKPGWTAYTYPHPLAVPPSGGSPCPSGINVCKVTIPGNYTTSTGQLETALTDAITWQAGTCAPYIIEIAAGTVIHDNLVLHQRTCTAVIEVRSSGVAQISGRVNPGTQSALMATLSGAIANGEVIDTTTTEIPAYYAFRGIKFTVDPGLGHAFCIVCVGLQNGSQILSLQPHNIEFDRVWITGIYGEQGPHEAIRFQGSNHSLHDSYVEKALSTEEDTQAVLIDQSNSVRISNNYLDGAAENLFFSNNSVNTDAHGNYIYKPPYLKWNCFQVNCDDGVGGTTAAPGGSNVCLSDANSGERWTQWASAYTEQTTGGNVLNAANNGSGLIRLQIASTAGMSTGDRVLIANGIATNTGDVASFLITVVDGTHIDLQGSAFAGTGGPGGWVGKVVGQWVCIGGTWTSTTTLNGGFYAIKNNWETKGTVSARVWGNYMENAWYGSQWESMIINVVNGSFYFEDINIWANKAINNQMFFVISGFANNNAWGPRRVSVHDNLSPSGSTIAPQTRECPFQIGYGGSQYTVTNATWSGGIATLTIGAHRAFVGQAGVQAVSIVPSGYNTGNTTITANTPTTISYAVASNPGSYVSGGQVFGGGYPDVAQDVSIFHNTAIQRFDNMAAFVSCAMLTQPNQMIGINRLSDNIMSNGYYGVYGLVPGAWDQWNQANINSGFTFGYNILTTVDQPGFMGPFTTSAPPSTQWTLTDKWLHTADYSTVFNSVSGNYNTWDYTCKSSYTDCHNNGSDGRDRGADIALVNNATGNAVSGRANAFFDMTLKPPSAIGTTTATIPYVAPSTATCTLTVYSDEAHSTSVFTNTDGGGNPARSGAVTGLTTQHMYWPVLSCSSGTYVLSSSAGVQPFTTH